MERYGKAIADIQGSDDPKFGENGGFTAILSTPSLDRDGDRLAREEWQDLPDRLPLDMDHGMTVADTIGSFRPYFDGDALMMDAVFASTPKAQEVRTLVAEGHINSVSVAFMTDRSKKDGEPRRELLNAGVVAIPSNRDALILASKAFSALKDAIPAVSEADRAEFMAAEGKDTLRVLLDCLEDAEPVIETKDDGVDDGAVEDADVKAPQGQSAGSGDRAMLQAIHDASVHMGAVCVIPLQGDEDSSGSDDGANKSISFASEDGQVVRFESHEQARDFFTDMLKSIEDADANEETLVEVGQMDTSGVEPDSKLDAFAKALADVLPPRTDDSPAEAAAATDEVPAPADEAADEPVDMATRVRAMEMSMALLMNQLSN